MPPTGLDEGIQAATRLRETHPDVGVVVLSQYAEPGYALALLEHGTAGRGYLLKERVDDLAQLVGAIEAVAAGGSVIDPKVVEASSPRRHASKPRRSTTLTPRERDVLREMAEGKNNAAIAADALPHRAIGRERDPLDLPQARDRLGAVRAQAREGRHPVPGRGRLDMTGNRPVSRARGAISSDAAEDVDRPQPRPSAIRRSTRGSVPGDARTRAAPFRREDGDRARAPSARRRRRRVASTAAK